MATATILSIENTTLDDATVKIYSGGTLVYDETIASGNTATLSESVPEAGRPGGYSNNHVEVTVEGTTSTYSFWQNGTEIYYSLEDQWNDDQLMEFDPSATPGDSDIKLKIELQNSEGWVVGEVTDV